MTSARFRIQAAFVTALILLVSLPEQRRVRAGEFWHAPVVWKGSPRDASDARSNRFDGQRALIGYGSASGRFGGGSAALNRRLSENDLEGRRGRISDRVLELGGKINAILGYARSAANTPMPYARLMLRNIATGEIEARGTADEKGRFTFLDVIPSGYIVELVDANGLIVATSELIEIARNDVRETTVRASGRRTPTALFGGALMPTAYEAVGTAANQGVNEITPADRCASPPCNTSFR